MEIKIMSDKESTKVTLDLSKELSAEELKSFQERAEQEGHTLQEHLRVLVFGDAKQEKGAA